MTRLIALITGIYLVLAFLLIWMIAGSIAEPINKLRLQADRIGNGQYEQIQGTCSIAELEELKGAINRMAENLKLSEEKMPFFFQNVSHDLRTPLATIGGYAQGIQCGVFKEPEKAAGIILQESGRMTELVESILMLSRLDSRAYETEPVSIQLKEFLQEQAEILTGTAGEKKIIVEEDSAAVSVNADAKLLTRIIQNVIGNSLRYAESLVMVRVDAASQWAVVCISDNGPGVSAGDLPHVFERFYKGKNGNFGIGLSVVQSGMQYMGGSAEIENRMPPAHGAVYRLRFPAE